MREVKASNNRLEAMVADVRQGVTRIEAMLAATMPHLATKAELAEGLKVLPQLATKAELDEGLRTLPHVATKAEVAEVLNTLPHLATKAELAEVLNTLPHLATKEELADKPGKTYLVSLMAILLAAYGAGLAALAVLK